MVILFDLDGTLIDSTDAILESFHSAFDAQNTPSPNDEEIKPLIGYPLDIMFEKLGIPRDIVWDYVASYKEHYREISTAKTILLEGAKEAVELASSFATIGIVTTKTAEYSQILMEHFGIMHHFDVLIGREHVQNPKPHEEPILKAIEKLNTHSKEIWMIGDTKLDLISAKNAGVNSIAVSCGYDDYETLKEFGNIILPSTFKAIEHLQNRNI